MKIIILGAGQVGSALISSMVLNGDEVTVVDTDSEKLRALGSHLDVKTIVGHAPAPEILEKAGAKDADILIAVTNCDEYNMIACQVAYSLYQVPRKIARIRSPSYTVETIRKKLFDDSQLPVDVYLIPEQIVANEIIDLVNYPGALQVLSFGQRAIHLIGYRVKEGDAMEGSTPKALDEMLQKNPVFIGAIYRKHISIEWSKDTAFLSGDEIFFACKSSDSKKIMSTITKKKKMRCKNIFIAGGGSVGFRLAQALEKNHQIRLIEIAAIQAQKISNQLDNAVVVQGCSSNKNLLLEEGIEDCDLFISVTNDAAINIMSAIQAKRLGAKKTIVLTPNTEYLDLIEENKDIDISICPSHATISSVMAYARKNDTIGVHQLKNGVAEVMEIIAHAGKNSQVVGVPIKDIKLHANSSIVAICRIDNEGKKQVLGANSNLIIEDGDHVIILVGNSSIKQIEKLFYVNTSLF